MIIGLRNIATTVAIGLGLTACANLTAKQEQIDSVIASQMEVLKKTKSQREQADVKSRVAKDSVLVEKEKLLIDALSSVIGSQEAYLKLKNKIENK